MWPTSGGGNSSLDYFLNFPFPNTLGSYVNKAKRDVRAELIASLPRPHFEFLSRCESYFETNDFVASHSGVNPACPESRELAEICACLTPLTLPLRPLNFLWYAVTTYKPLKHLWLAAPLSA